HSNLKGSGAARGADVFVAESDGGAGCNLQLVAEECAITDLPASSTGGSGSVREDRTAVLHVVRSLGHGVTHQHNVNRAAIEFGGAACDLLAPGAFLGPFRRIH